MIVNKIERGECQVVTTEMPPPDWHLVHVPCGRPSTVEVFVARGVEFRLCEMHAGEMAFRVLATCLDHPLKDAMT